MNLNATKVISIQQIEVIIVDTNNKRPSFENFDAEIKIYENATSNDPITEVHVSDIDRDYPHNSVQFLINFNGRPQLQRYFAIDESSGELTVQLLGDFVLDRDNGEPDHLIPITVQDNFGGNGCKFASQSRKFCFSVFDTFYKNFAQIETPTRLLCM